MGSYFPSLLLLLFDPSISLLFIVISMRFFGVKTGFKSVFYGLIASNCKQETFLWFSPLVLIILAEKPLKTHIRLVQSILLAVTGFLTEWEKNNFYAKCVVFMVGIAGFYWEKEGKVAENREEMRFIDLDGVPSEVIWYKEGEWRGNGMALRLLEVESEGGIGRKLAEVRLEGGMTVGEAVERGVGGDLGTTIMGEKTVRWRVGGSSDSGYVVMPSDITQSEHHRRLAQLESSSKSALIRSISHEVNTPLNTIFYLSSAMHSEITLTEQLKLLNINCKLLCMVLNDVIDYAEIMAGRCEVKKTYFKLKTCVRKVVDLYGYQVEKKGLQLKLQIDPFIPCKIYSDERRISQLLQNLLSNAVKYTLHGSISILFSFLDSGKMRISVQDTGVGIAENSLETIFHMHMQDESKGAGMGLFVSTIVAKRLGSERIWVQSEEGKGATFWADVDIGEQAIVISSPTVYSGLLDTDEATKPLVKPVKLMNLLTINQRTCADVLIVDDNEFNRTILKMMLDKLGLTSEEAVSGLQAVQIVLKNPNNSFKLIIMDVEMPEMDGIEATRVIVGKHRSGEVKEMPRIVALSAYPGVQMREKCLMAGMQEFLSKPLAMEQLQRLVGVHCGHRRSRHATV